jgi:AcrR family transcriptional regulator
MTAPDRRAVRHAATKAEIVGAAWRLARERGLAGWALRDVAEAVGMRTPSLYVYVDSKNALYDSMFADGYRQLLARVDVVEADLRVDRPPPHEVLRVSAALFVDFAVEDPARFQLLFLRTLPGFEPSEQAYALAREALDRLAVVLGEAGAGASEQLDLWTALCTGLATQQVSNDPGGDRWRRLIDRAVDMFAATELPNAGSAG